MKINWIFFLIFTALFVSCAGKPGDSQKAQVLLQKAKWELYKKNNGNSYRLEYIFLGNRPIFADGKIFNANPTENNQSFIYEIDRNGNKNGLFDVDAIFEILLSLLDSEECQTQLNLDREPPSIQDFLSNCDGYFEGFQILDFSEIAP